MPLKIVPLAPKENAHVVHRAPHCPLRFTIWASKPNELELPILFRRSPFPEKDLRRIAMRSPTLPHLDLLVFERNGATIGFLGHPDEYLSRSWKTQTPRFRAKVVSASGRFLAHLQASLLPNVLEEMLSTIGKRLQLTRNAVDELHRREEEHVHAAHLLLPHCTSIQHVPIGRVVRRA